MIPTKRGNGGRIRILLICVGLLSMSWACGQKGPPVVPKDPVPPAVEDLQGEAVGEKVRLSWTVPRDDDRPFPGLSNYRLYRYKFSSTAEDCPGCPIPFKYFLEIKAADPWPAWQEGDRIVFEDPVRPDDRYAYKVLVYHWKGGVSEDSNILFIGFSEEELKNVAPK